MLWEVDPSEVCFHGTNTDPMLSVHCLSNSAVSLCLIQVFIPRRCGGFAVVHDVLQWLVVEPVACQSHMFDSTHRWITQVVQMNVFGRTCWNIVSVIVEILNLRRSFVSNFTILMLQNVNEVKQARGVIGSLLGI